MDKYETQNTRYVMRDGTTGALLVDGEPIGAGATQQAADYTFALTDAGTVVEGTKATAQTFTVPKSTTVAFPIGAEIEVLQYGAGKVTIAAVAGVTLRSPGGDLSVGAQYGTIRLRHRAVDEWVLSGDVGA